MINNRMICVIIFKYLEFQQTFLLQTPMQDIHRYLRQIFFDAVNNVMKVSLCLLNPSRPESCIEIKI